MASLTQWTRVRANSGRWWRTGKSGMLQSMESQRVGQDWATEQPLLKVRKRATHCSNCRKGVVMDRIELNCTTPSWCSRISWWCGENTHTKLVIRNIRWNIQASLQLAAGLGANPDYWDLHLKESQSLICVQHFAVPMDCNPQDSSVHGIFQARVLEWVAISFSIYT